MTTHISLIELIIYATGYSIIKFTTKYRQKNLTKNKFPLYLIDNLIVEPSK